MSNILETVLVNGFNFVSDQTRTLFRNLKRHKNDFSRLILGSGSSPLVPNQHGEVWLSPEDRSKHIYVAGSTGSGKSKFLEGLIRQDILRQHGCGTIDPHGNLVDSILAFLVEILNEREKSKLNHRRERYSQKEFLPQVLDRLILVDLSGEKCIGFNPLEVTEKNLIYQQTLELVEVFRLIWEDSWGPRMEELLRNSFYTLSENNLTLIEMPRLLADSAFRTLLAESLGNEEVKDYWLRRFNQLSPGMRSQYIEPVANKLSAFIADPFIRAMLAQQKSTLNFRKIMDEGKILLINLSKGKFKENAFLIGALFLAKIQMAALSRQDIPESSRCPWYLYIDEFQNFATDTFETILSESRKYGLGLIMAHQNLASLKKKLRESILGNTFTQVLFRLGRGDADELSGELAFDGRQMFVKDLIDLKTREAFVKIKGQPAMKIKTPKIQELRVSQEMLHYLKEKILKAHCKSRKEIEAEIQERKQRIDEMIRARMNGGDGVETEKKHRTAGKPAIGSGQEFKEIE